MGFFSTSLHEGSRFIERKKEEGITVSFFAEESDNLCLRVYPEHGGGWFVRSLSVAVTIRFGEIREGTRGRGNL